jgi:hypothetical protein
MVVRRNETMRTMNGERVTRVGNTIFIPLPRSQWKACGKCHCQNCQGRDGFWDTLAIAASPRKGEADTAWTVHRPEGHPSHDLANDLHTYWTDPATVPEAIPFGALTNG